MPRRADERTSLLVFVVAWPFADEHHLGPDVTFPWDRLGTRLGEAAQLAGPDLRLQLFHARRFERRTADIRHKCKLPLWHSYPHRAVTASIIRPGTPH